jgi:hypothetical protein
MKKNILFLFLALFSISAFAQENVELALGGETFNFKGIKSFKPTTEHSSKCYYLIEDGKLMGHEISYAEEGFPFGYYVQEVLLSDLNLKSYSISDMNSGSTLPFKGWLLSIETKKLKDKVKKSVYTFVDPTETSENTSYVSILFNSKEAAQALYDKLNAN